MVTPPSRQPGISAFDWDVYKSRKSALVHLLKTETQVDTLLECEDGSSRELVHSQVVSAFGDKLTDFIRRNGEYISLESCAHLTHHSNRLAKLSSARLWALDANGQQTLNGQVKRVRLGNVNKFTLSILVDCAYTGYIRADLNSGGIWQVLEMAEHYEMADVIRACCNFLASNLDRLNCVKFYHIGLKHHNPLLRAAWHTIRSNFKYILAEQLKAIEGKGELNADQAEVKNQLSLASLRFEHFENLLSHDKLNVDNEESIWYAIKLWCRLNPNEASSRLAALLGCMRFPRFRTGTDFSARYIWRDPLVLNNRFAQQELAILDRNHRDFLASSSSSSSIMFDGYSLPCALSPRQLRPRVPHSILLAIGGWQQGQPTRLIESYDVNCNLWFQSKRKIMSPLAYHGIECINGLLYVCGGTDGNEILNELFTFDPLRGECAQKASMREPRCYVSTASLERQYLFALGGHNGNQRMKSVERYSVQENCWAHVQDMNVARSDASACVHNSLIYIAGGLNDQVIESSCEFYNQLDNSWTFITSMLIPRTSFSLLLYKNSLLAIGGNNGSARLSSVEQYNFSTKQWSPHSLMKHRRSTFSAALLDEDKLIVVGGYNGQTPFNQVEMYDEPTRSWHSIQKIRFDRSGLKVVVVSELSNAYEYSFAGSAGGASGAPATAPAD